MLKSRILVCGEGFNKKTVATLISSRESAVILTSYLKLLLEIVPSIKAFKITHFKIGSLKTAPLKKMHVRFPPSKNTF